MNDQIRCICERASMPCHATHRDPRRAVEEQEEERDIVIVPLVQAGFLTGTKDMCASLTYCTCLDLTCLDLSVLFHSIWIHYSRLTSATGSVALTSCGRKEDDFVRLDLTSETLYCLTRK
jgi:hypothetical protein